MNLWKEKDWWYWLVTDCLLIGRLVLGHLPGHCTDGYSDSALFLPRQVHHCFPGTGATGLPAVAGAGNVSTAGLYPLGATRWNHSCRHGRLLPPGTHHGTDALEPQQAAHLCTGMGYHCLPTGYGQCHEGTAR
jgi:hypothetical protein